METKVLRNGKVVLNKTYSNRTQAEKAASKIEGSKVIKMPASRVFYVEVK